MRILPILVLLGPLFLFCQIGPASLSVGASEVLFEKGQLDVELLGEIISEKQSELKKEFAKRLILNQKLSDGPYLTYYYAKNTLNALLEHENQGVIKKSLLENGAELAIVLGITEAYMGIKEGTVAEIERRYLQFLLDGELFKTHPDVPSIDPAFLRKYLGESGSTIKVSEKAVDVKWFDGKTIKYEWDDKRKLKVSNESVVNLMHLAFHHSGVYPSQIMAPNLVNSKSSSRKNLGNQDFSIKTKYSGEFLPKIFRIYELKNLGYYEVPYGGITVVKDKERKLKLIPEKEIVVLEKEREKMYLHYIVLDMFLEICRNNRSLQRLGFFQKSFDQDVFENRSAYRKLLALRDDPNFQKNDNYRVLAGGLEDIYIQADKMINQNLVFASAILNQPTDTLNQKAQQLKGKIELLVDKMIPLTGVTNRKEFIETARLQIQKYSDNLDYPDLLNSIYSTSDRLTDCLLSLEMKEKFIGEEKKIIDELSSLILNTDQILKKKSAQKEFSNIALEIEKQLPKLIRLKTTNPELVDIVVNLRVLLETLNKWQYIELKRQISSISQIRSPAAIREKVQDAQNTIVYEVRTELAEVFKVITELDKAKSYDQIAKLIVDVGDIFYDISDSRVLDELANLQAYLIVNEEKNKVDVQVEDLVLYLGDKYVKNASGLLSMYFSVGFNYGGWFGSTEIESSTKSLNKRLNYASEKIGLKVKLLDIHKRRINSRYFIEKPKPLIKEVYLLGYGSGLLYQIEALKSDKSINGASFGTGVGLRFLNDLDFNLTASSIRVDKNSGWFVGAGFDIPITEYLGRLSKKKQQAKEE